MPPVEHQLCDCLRIIGVALEENSLESWVGDCSLKAERTNRAVGDRAGSCPLPNLQIGVA